jgi:hypothetical protein
MKEYLALVTMFGEVASKRNFAFENPTFALICSIH